MWVYLVGFSEGIGGPSKTNEIHEGKFGRRIHHRGHTVKGSECLAMLSEILVKRFSFPLRTEPLTL
jgi:hypothetical protein